MPPRIIKEKFDSQDKANKIRLKHVKKYFSNNFGVEIDDKYIEWAHSDGSGAVKHIAKIFYQHEGCVYLIKLSVSVHHGASKFFCQPAIPGYEDNVFDIDAQQVQLES